MEAECITGAFYHMNIVNVVYLGRPSWGGGEEEQRGGGERGERGGGEGGELGRTERERVLNNLYCQSVQGLEF